MQQQKVPSSFSSCKYQIQVCLFKICSDILKNGTENMRNREKDIVKKQQIDFFKQPELLEVKVLIIETKNSMVSSRLNTL